MAVITISRQFGSGAKEMAAKVCQTLGYRYFDKELIAQVASEVGLLENEAIDFSEEHYQGKNLLERLFRPGPYIVAKVPAWRRDQAGVETLGVKRLDEFRFINLIRGIILAAYNQDNVIIVGRGGQVILENMPGVLHVRVEAPMGARIRRIQTQAGLSIEEAHQLAIERDRAATKYLGQLFGVRWDDPLLYHLVLNTGKWKIETAAQIIIHAVNQLQTEPKVMG